MGRARLTRIDALQDMAAAVDVFRTEAIVALENLDMEIRRALQWIHHDCREHWNHQVRQGYERVSEAQVQLQQARTARRIGEHDPACIDEKKALARAKRRLEVAQEKVESVRHYTRAIDHAVNEYRGVRSQLSSWLEADSLKALAALQRMMDNVEAYLALHAPGGGSSSVMGRREQGAGSGEQGAGTAAGVVGNSDPANDADEKPALQTDAVPDSLSAPFSKLPASNSPAGSAGDAP